MPSYFSASPKGKPTKKRLATERKPFFKSKKSNQDD